jgi:hypothetical protein
MRMGFLLSILCSVCPVDMNKPYILASAAETAFFQFKEQVPFNLKLTYLLFNVKGRYFD